MFFAFAKGKGRKGHAERSEHKPPLPHLQPPERRGGITRRQAIPIIAAGTSILAGGILPMALPQLDNLPKNGILKIHCNASIVGKIPSANNFNMAPPPTDTKATFSAF